MDDDFSDDPVITKKQPAEAKKNDAMRSGITALKQEPESPPKENRDHILSIKWDNRDSVLVNTEFLIDVLLHRELEAIFEEEGIRDEESDMSSVEE